MPLDHLSEWQGLHEAESPQLFALARIEVALCGPNHDFEHLQTEDIFGCAKRALCGELAGFVVYTVVRVELLQNL